MSTDTLTAPTGVAYFTVRVPVRECEDGYASRARSIVENYLYGGAEVVEVELAEDMITFEVLVRREGWESRDRLEYLVNYQRDRLASGMYFAGPATYLVPA